MIDDSCPDGQKYFFSLPKSNLVINGATSFGIAPIINHDFESPNCWSRWERVCIFFALVIAKPNKYQISGRQMGLFIYTARQVSPGEELRYNYNAQSEASSHLWRPSPPGFCSKPEVSNFLADVKTVKVQNMPSTALTACLDLAVKNLPGRFIVMSLKDCKHIAENVEASGLRRCDDFLWMFTIRNGSLF